MALSACVIALCVGLHLPAGSGLTRRDALAAVATTPALLARPAAAPAATSAVPAKDIESIKVLTYMLTYLLCLYTIGYTNLVRAANRGPVDGLHLP